MSARYWREIIKIVPRFPGSDEDAEENELTHTWVVSDITTEPPEVEVFVPEIVVCKVCAAMADTEQAKYPCGQVPEPVPMAQFLRERKKPTAGG